METAFQPLPDGRHCRSRVVDGVLTFELVYGNEESCTERFARLAAQQREAEAKAAAAEADMRRFALSIASLERAGDVAALVCGMQRYGADAAVQHGGCKALRSLALNNAVKAAIAAQGGIGAVRAAMDRHRESAGVQEEGCGALQNLALNNDADKAAIAAQGGIGAVLGAMGGHRESAGVQQQGCGALRSLALNNAVKAAIAAHGGIGTVLGAMGGHPESAGVQQQGCGALRTLALNSSDNKAAIAEQGGIGTVLGAMGGHPESAGVQEEGCGALRILALRDASSSPPLESLLPPPPPLGEAGAAGGEPVPQVPPINWHGPRVIQTADALFDRNRCGSGATLHVQDTRVKFSGMATVLLTSPVPPEGVHAMQFEVHGRDQCLVGIVSPDYDVETYLGDRRGGYGFFAADGQIKIDGDWKSSQGLCKYKCGDRVAVHVDMSRRSLQFSISRWVEEGSPEAAAAAGANSSNSEGGKVWVTTMLERTVEGLPSQVARLTPKP